MRFWDLGITGTPTVALWVPAPVMLEELKKQGDGPCLGEGTPILPVLVGEGGGPVWTLDGGIIFIGASYFFNMYCFILNSILFLFLSPKMALLINKWLVYLFLEHSISFQVSLGTAENCSPLTCGGNKTTGFPPLWATCAVRVPRAPQEGNERCIAFHTCWIQVSHGCCE